MFTATVIGLAALLILIFIVEVVLRKSRRQNSADGEVTPCQSGDSAPADGTTTHPAGGHHHTPHSATDASGHYSGHSDEGSFSGHGGFDGGGGGHGH